MNVQLGYTETLCYKCWNTAGGFRTRILTFKQGMNCDIALTPLT